MFRNCETTAQGLPLLRLRRYAQGVSDPQSPEPSKYRYATDFPVGEVCVDFQDPQSGLRGLVVRGPSSFCAYVGAPQNHAVYELEELNFQCHFGITFRGPGSKLQGLPADWYFFGWDYAHFSDAVDCPELLEVFKQLRLEVPDFIQERLVGAGRGLGKGAKRWTVEEVTEDLFDALFELREALAQSESFARALRAPASGPSC